VSVLNRNIITAADVAAARAGNPPRTLAANPPAGIVPGAQAAVAVGPGGVPISSEDDYLTKVLKYLPLEVVGAYLFIAGVVDSNVTIRRDHAYWLGGLLIGFGIITALYDWRVLKIVRITQMVMSVVALVVYVFAVGGWFATTSWYHPWYAAIALPIFALLVAIVPVPPLPA
jgi:hypothetical protein